MNREEYDDFFDKFCEQIDKKEEYRKFYSSFENYPTSIKKMIFINISISLMILILFLICVLYKDYFTFLLLAVCTLIISYLLLKVYVVISSFKNANFVTFTGKIIDSYECGSKVLNNKHFIIKLLSDEQKEMCFKYFGEEDFSYDQYLTLFIPEQAEIIISDYGPMVKSYIEVVSTDEIESREKIVEMKESKGKEKITANEFINNK